MKRNKCYIHSIDLSREGGNGYANISRKSS